MLWIDIGFVGHSFFPVLILARLIQETGAAALGCSCTLYSEREQGESIWADRVRRINGKGAGPAIGGMVAHYIHWSYLLLVPTATIITVPFLIKQLKKEERISGHFHIPNQNKNKR